MQVVAGQCGAQGGHHAGEVERALAAVPASVHGVLEEVLFRFEVGGFLPRTTRATVAEHGREWVAELEVSGERRDPARHPVRVLIKGVTYHALAVERVAEGWRAKVIFDI